MISRGHEHRINTFLCLDWDFYNYTPGTTVFCVTVKGVTDSVKVENRCSSDTARTLQILRDGFDSRLESIAFGIKRVAADSNSTSVLRSLPQLQLFCVQRI